MPVFWFADPWMDDNRDRDDAMQLNMQGKTNKCPPTGAAQS